jgi:hypothetical protein
MRTFVGIGALLAAAWIACAQVDVGAITGRVADATGAVVAGAQVSVTTQSNEEGAYRVQPLRPGSYRVTVVAAGFKRFIREGIDLRLGSVIAVDAALEVGAVADSIEVKAVAPLLDTETSTTGQFVSGNYLYRLPLYQRSVKMMAFFTPGLTTAGTPYNGSFDSFHIAGMRNIAIGYFEDGMLGIDIKNTGGWTTGTIENTVEEVKLITTVPPAEYSHTAGGGITVVEGDRFTPGNQNGLIDSMESFAYPAAFTEGRAGKNIMYAQRQIAHSLSASKEVPIKERLRFQFRFDFQNPLKWYDWGNPSTTVDFRNPWNFGKISGTEFTTAFYGGLPMMNITLALKW